MGCCSILFTILTLSERSVLCRGRVELTGGFLLTAAALYYLDADGILIWGVLACILHELGHYAAIRALGGRVARIRLSAAGAEMILSTVKPLDHLAQVLAAISGPVANLTLALLSARTGERGAGECAWLFAGFNLALACFNLLPISQLDGGRALFHFLALICSEYKAVQIAKVISFMTTGVIFAIGCFVFWESSTNFTLLFTALWMIATGTNIKKLRNKEKTK